MTAVQGSRLVLTVDCSTTAVKAVIFDAAGRTVSLVREPLALLSPQPGWHEQDAESWWRAARAAMTRAVAEVDDPGLIGAVCLTHQRESFVCLDEDDAPIRPAILWLDGRAARQIRELGSTSIHATSGKPADITPSIYKLAWLKENEPQTLRRARRVGDVSAFLTLRLTGRWASSVASLDSLGLFELAHHGWAPELLDLAGVERGQLPDLVDAGELVAPLLSSVTEELGLPAETPLIAGIGDGQAAGIGAAAVAPGVAYLNLGTAIVLGVQAQGYHWGPEFRTLASCLPDEFTLETWISSGTHLTNWFRGNFGDPALAGAPDPALDEAAGRLPPGSDGLITVPYWNAAQAPHWDPDARGLVVGWHAGHGRPHVYRSLIEGIAYELRLQLEGLEKATDTQISTLRGMGGGTRSPLLTQIVADVTQRPLEICLEEEISALGVGVMAQAWLHGGSHHTRDLAARTARIARRVDPDPSRRHIYEDLFAFQRELYPRVADLYPTLTTLRHRARAPSDCS